MSNFRLFSNFAKPFFRASDIKKDPVLRQKSVRLGVTSIIFSLVAVAVAFGGALLFKFSMDFMHGSSALVGLFLLVFAIAILFGSLSFAVYGLIYMILQLTVNRRAIGWIALVIFLAAVAGAIVIILATLGGMQ